MYTERSKRIAFALSVFLAVSMLPVFSAYADGGKETQLKEEKKQNTTRLTENFAMPQVISRLWGMGV